MIKEAFVGKGAIAIGGAVVFCGLTLFAAGQVLDYLFRDVDPKRNEEICGDEPEEIEAGDAVIEDAAVDPV